MMPVYDYRWRLKVSTDRIQTNGIRLKFVAGEIFTNSTNQPQPPSSGRLNLWCPAKSCAVKVDLGMVELMSVTLSPAIPEPDPVESELDLSLEMR